MSKAKKVNWNGEATGPIILISGPEDFLASRAIRAIKDRLRVSDPLIEISELEAGEYTPGSIYDLVAPSLFNEPRLLIIRGVERCTDALIEDGLAYLNDITPESTLVFYHSSGVRGKKLLDALCAVLSEKMATQGDKSNVWDDEWKTVYALAAEVMERVQKNGIYGPSI